MAEIEFDIKDLYNQKFGRTIALPFPDAFKQNNNSRRINERNIKSSMLGAQIHLPCRIGISEKELFELPNEPIISINGSKDVVVTAINRGKTRGTVKEEINLNDYKINIKGIIINEKENAFPDSIIREMRNILEAGGAIEIRSPILKIFNITLATVMEFRFPREWDTQLRWCSYEIDLISDEDFELELIN